MASAYHRHIIQNVDKLSTTAAAFTLYRTVLKELPRVLVLYDIDMPLMDAKKAMVHHFRKYDHVRDPRATNTLLAKGYMELEETLLQWKQKSHVLRMLEPAELKVKINLDELSAMERLDLGIKDEGISRLHQNMV